MKVKAVEKIKSGVDVAVDGAKLVDSFGPVEVVGYRWIEVCGDFGAVLSV